MTILHLFLFFGVILISHNQCYGSNILGLFPHHGYSHFKVYYPILRALAARGHNVTVIGYIKSVDPHPNYEELLLTGKETVHSAVFDEFTPTRTLNVLLQEYYSLHREGQDSCNTFYQSSHVQTVRERHTSTPYDLVIMEFFNTDCYLAVPYLLQVPVIGISSCALMPWLYDRVLLPDFPSHVQSEFVGFPHTMNWQERLINFVQAKTIKYLYRYYTNYHDNQLIRRYLHIDVDVDEIAKKNTALIFVNQHYSLSGNRPSTPQVVEIGGVHVDDRKTNETLSPELLNFLQQSESDVLFISFGSMLRGSSLPASKVTSIISVIRTLPLKVIWKWEADTPPVHDKQFLFVKWAPQLALLCHPKVKLFWGHGGLLGTTEAVYCGKPLLVTPIYGDQFLNAHAAVNRKIGRILLYDEIDQANVALNVRETMASSYQKNAVALSNIFRNRLVGPLDSALWWIEHLLKNGQKAKQVLSTEAVHLNWFVYHSLDSVALLLLPFVVFLPMILLCIRKTIQPKKRKLKKK